MEMWKENILESIRKNDTLSAHHYAAAAIGNPQNIFLKGALYSKKIYNTYLPLKGNREYFLIDKSTKEKFALYKGDIVSIIFGNIYITGVLDITNDYANILPFLDQSDLRALEGIIPSSAILLIRAKDYQ